jgi:hypothetical protein
LQRTDANGKGELLKYGARQFPNRDLSNPLAKGKGNEQEWRDFLRVKQARAGSCQSWLRETTARIYCEQTLGEFANEHRLRYHNSLLPLGVGKTKFKALFTPQTAGLQDSTSWPAGSHGCHCVYTPANLPSSFKQCVICKNFMFFKNFMFQYNKSYINMCLTSIYCVALHVLGLLRKLHQ